MNGNVQSLSSEQWLFSVSAVFSFIQPPQRYPFINSSIYQSIHSTHPFIHSSRHSDIIEIFLFINDSSAPSPPQSPLRHEIPQLKLPGQIGSMMDARDKKEPYRDFRTLWTICRNMVNQHCSCFLKKKLLDGRILVRKNLVWAENFPEQI